MNNNNNGPQVHRKYQGSNAGTTLAGFLIGALAGAGAMLSWRRSPGKRRAKSSRRAPALCATKPLEE